MRFEDWEPHYLRILDTFGFDRKDDEEAAGIAAALTSRDDTARLEDLCTGRTVTVCGNAPCLKDDLPRCEGTVFAADAAADVLWRAGIRPDAVFTDLDGAEESFVAMNREGTVMVVHAHGDNITLVRRWVPMFGGPLVLTCPTRPFRPVQNWGGFTDGDRAVFAADALGADNVVILGFDLDDLTVPPMKRGKLLWARALLSLIGYDL